MQQMLDESPATPGQPPQVGGHASVRHSDHAGLIRRSATSPVKTARSIDMATLLFSLDERQERTGSSVGVLASADAQRGSAVAVFHVARNRQPVEARADEAPSRAGSFAECRDDRARIPALTVGGTCEHDCFPARSPLVFCPGWGMVVTD